MQKPRLPEITSCTHSWKVGMLQFSYVAFPPISDSAHQGPSRAWLARGSRSVAAPAAITMSILRTTAASRHPGPTGGALGWPDQSKGWSWPLDGIGRPHLRARPSLGHIATRGYGSI